MLDLFFYAGIWHSTVFCAVYLSWQIIRAMFPTTRSCQLIRRNQRLSLRLPLLKKCLYTEMDLETLKYRTFCSMDPPPPWSVRILVGRRQSLVVICHWLVLNIRGTVALHWCPYVSDLFLYCQPCVLKGQRMKHTLLILQGNEDRSVLYRSGIQGDEKGVEGWEGDG